MASNPRETREQRAEREASVHIVNKSKHDLEREFDGMTTRIPAGRVTSVTTERAWHWFGDRRILERTPADRNREIRQVYERYGGEKGIWAHLMKSGDLYIHEWGPESSTSAMDLTVEARKQYDKATSMDLGDFLRLQGVAGKDLSVDSEASAYVGDLGELNKATALQKELEQHVPQDTFQEVGATTGRTTTAHTSRAVFTDGDLQAGHALDKRMKANR